MKKFYVNVCVCVRYRKKTSDTGKIWVYKDILVTHMNMYQHEKIKFINSSKNYWLYFIFSDFLYQQLKNIISNWKLDFNSNDKIIHN